MDAHRTERGRCPAPDLGHPAAAPCSPKGPPCGLRYFLVAETFAPLAECLLFHVAFRNPDEPASARRDSSTIVVANLASFGTGMLLQTYGWL